MSFVQGTKFYSMIQNWKTFLCNSTRQQTTASAKISTACAVLVDNTTTISILSSPAVGSTALK